MFYCLVRFFHFIRFSFIKLSQTPSIQIAQIKLFLHSICHPRMSWRNNWPTNYEVNHPSGLRFHFRCALTCLYCTRSFRKFEHRYYDEVRKVLICQFAECLIYSKWYPNDLSLIIPRVRCQHYYYQKCMKDWLRWRNFCLICKRNYIIYRRQDEDFHLGMYSIPEGNPSNNDALQLQQEIQHIQKENQQQVNQQQRDEQLREEQERAISALLLQTIHLEQFKEWIELEKLIRSYENREHTQEYHSVEQKDELDAVQWLFSSQTVVVFPPAETSENHH